MSENILFPISGNFSWKYWLGMLYSLCTKCCMVA